MKTFGVRIIEVRIIEVRINEDVLYLAIFLLFLGSLAWSSEFQGSYFEYLFPPLYRYFAADTLRPHVLERLVKSLDALLHILIELTSSTISTVPISSMQPPISAQLHKCSKEHFPYLLVFTVFEEGSFIHRSTIKGEKLLCSLS